MKFLGGKKKSWKKMKQQKNKWKWRNTLQERKLEHKRYHAMSDDNKMKRSRKRYITSCSLPRFSISFVQSGLKKFLGLT